MNNNKDTLGNRMKGYENISRIYLTKRNPVIIRIDGKAFHTFTRGLKRPFDNLFMETMQYTAKELCESISGCKLAYIQSDEISLLLTDYDTINTQPWFENNLQKLVSVAASIATLAFNKHFFARVDEICDTYGEHRLNINPNLSEDYMNVLVSKLFRATFDARAFILPKEEVCNYFIWRQQDASRNSILSVAQSVLSPKEMHGKKCDELQDILFKQKGINWNNYPTTQKRGSCVVRMVVNKNGIDRHEWTIDNDIPIFTKDRSYVDDKVYIKADNNGTNS